MCILAQLSDPYVRSAQTKQSIAVRRHCVARQGARSATAACQSLERGLGCTAVSMHAVDSAAVLLRSACTVQCTYESLSSKLQRTTQHSIIALPLFATDDARSMREKRNGRSRNFLSYKEFGVRYPAKGVKYPPPSPTILYKPFLFSFKN